MSKLINRLVEASGGWENLLYETLKDVCEQLDYSEAGVCGGITREIWDVLEAYEETIKDRWVDESRKHNGKPNQIIPTPQVQKVVKDNKVEEVVKSNSEETGLSGKGAGKSDIIKLSDFILTPAPRSLPKPKRSKCRVSVGKDVGASSGELPIPANSKIVNRQNLLITTAGGLQLGVGCEKDGEEGQIKSQHVSGHISVSGAYRLVFKDIKLGTVLIHYEVVKLPSKLTKKQFVEEVAVANKISVEQLHERLLHFGLVCVLCNCGLADCFGWKIVDRAEIEATIAQREGKIDSNQISLNVVTAAAQRQEVLNAQRAEMGGAV